MKASRCAIGLAAVVLVCTLWGTGKRKTQHINWETVLGEAAPLDLNEEAWLQDTEGTVPRKATTHSLFPRATADPNFAASLPAAMQRLDKLRKQGLQAQKEFMKKDHLQGFPEARKAPIVRVCSPITNQEERQMCFKRGRRMYESLLRHFPKPLTRADALAWLKKEPKRPRRDGRVLYHIIIVDGEIAYYDSPGSELEGFRSWELSLLISQLNWNRRSGGFKGLGTFEIFLESPDKCIGGNEVPYPTVTYSKHANKCPSNTALEWNWIVQDAGWNMSKAMAAEVASRPFEDMQSIASFRGSCFSNDMRYYVAALSSATDRPYLDARCTDHGSQKRCGTALRAMKKVLPESHPLKAAVGPSLCPLGNPKSVYGDRLTYDVFVRRKYMLLVDGIGALFRLGPQLQSPGVVLLIKNKNYSLSFDEDMIPFVTYVPVTTDPARIPDELDQIYSWLEARPEVGKSIAKESSRWGALHADFKSYQRDWQLYMALLSDMHKPEPGIYKKFAKKPPIDCSSYENFTKKNDFFRWDPSTRKNGIYWAKRMYAIACLLDPFDL